MPPKISLKQLYFILIFVLSNTCVFGGSGLFDDNAMMEIVKGGVNNIYNFEFDQARKVYGQLHKEYPTHPAQYLYKSLMLYWKHFPVNPYSEEGTKYEQALFDAIEASEKMTENNKESLEGIFFNMIPRLMLIQFYSDNGISGKVMEHVRTSYRFVVKGFDLKDSFNEFYFSTGLYNYYREAYPESNPFYKPFLLFFPRGNKRQGLEELNYCWEHAVFMSPESMSFLAYIYINFEEDYREGLKFTQQLHTRYPKNPLFLSYQIQMLLLLKEYQAAIPYIKELATKNPTSIYFRMTSLVFTAIVEEHLRKDYNKAEKFYHGAIQFSDELNGYADSYTAYAYFGLSRINAEHGDQKTSRNFRKQAKNLARYSHVNFD